MSRADMLPEVPVEIGRKSTGIPHSVVRIDEVPVFNMSDGACYGLDPNIFYPEKPQIDLKEEMAKAICRSCKVIDACLDDALATREQYGIRGGATARERRNILRRTDRLAQTEAKSQTKIA